MKNLKTFLFIVIILSIFLIGCSIKDIDVDMDLEGSSISKSEILSSSNNTIPYDEDDSAMMQVHFIDVGQADCILIKSNNKYMLVDGGNNGDAQLIVSYLQNEGVNKLEYVIGTHPHEDHIGSLDIIINTFDIGKIIMPAVTNNTKTFEDVLDAIQGKGLKITKPVVGKSYILGDAEFVIIAPNKDYIDNYNNWSVGIRLTYKNNSFILNGDAEIEAERDIIDNGIDIKADVLKANHHGSSTSNSNAFLDAINPNYVVITSEVDNSYGHPHREVIDEFREREIDIYRTDIEGTIIATSDGTNITWNTEFSNGEGTNANLENSVTYVLNTNSKKLHYENCSSVASILDENRMISNESREVLIEQGYKPCGNCKP